MCPLCTYMTRYLCQIINAEVRKDKTVLVIIQYNSFKVETILTLIFSLWLQVLQCYGSRIQTYYDNDGDKALIAYLSQCVLYTIHFLQDETTNKSY